MKNFSKYFDYKAELIQSIYIAFNRCATQIASIVITSLLGLTSTQILAEFGLSLTLASVLFIAVTTIQLGVQAEFGRRFASGEYESLFSMFFSTALITVIISLVIGCGIWLLPNPFSNKASVELAENAYQSVKILIFSLPLVGLLTTITFFLESIGYIRKVTFLRIFQVWLQVGLVLITIFYHKMSDQLINTKLVTTAYVASDIIMLMIGLYLVISQFKKRVAYRMNLDFRNNAALLKVFQIGFPVMIGMLGQRFIFYSYVNLAASIGVVETSVFSIINSIIFLFQIPIIGVAHLFTIKLSQARGSKTGEEIDFVAAGFSKLFVMELFCIGGIIFIFQSFVFEIFTKDIRVSQLMNSLRVEIFLYFLMNAMLTYSMSYLRGFSDTLKPQAILISLLALGVVFLYAVCSDCLDMRYILLSFSISGYLAVMFLVVRVCNLKNSEINKGSVKEVCSAPQD